MLVDDHRHGRVEALVGGHHVVKVDGRVQQRHRVPELLAVQRVSQRVVLHVQVHPDDIPWRRGRATAKIRGCGGGGRRAGRGGGGGRGRGGGGAGGPGDGVAPRGRGAVLVSLPGRHARVPYSTLRPRCQIRRRHPSKAIELASSPTPPPSYTTVHCVAWVRHGGRGVRGWGQHSAISRTCDSKRQCLVAHPICRIPAENTMTS